MKNCIRIPIIYWSLMNIWGLFLSLLHGVYGNLTFDNLGLIILGTIILAFFTTLYTWPLLSFLPAMLDFKKVKEEMSTRYDIIHGDCACIHDFYKPSSNFINRNPQVREAYFSGYFFMTETAIIFKSDTGSSKYLNSDISIYYTSIQNVKKRFIFPFRRMNDGVRGFDQPIIFTTGIIITTNSEQTYKFIVGERKEIVSKIKSKTSCQ